MSEPLSKADNFWLCMDEPTNLMVITAFMEFEAPIDFARLRATIEARLTSFPRFKMRVQKPAFNIGSPRWKADKNYDIRSHLQRIALPPPGGKPELQETISNLMTTPLDPAKPLWKVHLIENYGGGCVLFFRIHHCIADGIALIHVLLSMADTDPETPCPTSDPPDRKKRPPSIDTLIPLKSMRKKIEDLKKSSQNLGLKALEHVLESVSNPAHLMSLSQTAGGLAADAASVLSRLTIPPADPDTPFKGKLGVHKSVAWTEPMPLERIKTIGRAISTTTLNDVLIATVTGAMRRYLSSRHVRVNELDLRVTVPVNIRKPGTEFELGNRFSLVFLSLPVYIEDPVLRLKEVKRRMDLLKNGPDAYVGFGLLNLLGNLPSHLAKRGAQIFGNKVSGVLTNVPGPRAPLYFAGRKISNMMFWVPRSGMVGLGISILSYDGKVTVGVAADSHRMPDPEALLEGFEAEFNHLLDLVQSGKLYEEPLVLHDRYQESRCRSLTKTGDRCKKRARAGSDYCSIHQPQDPSPEPQQP